MAASSTSSSRMPMRECRRAIFGAFSLLALFNAIPLSPDGFDDARLLRVVLDLGAQFADMHHDGIGADGKIRLAPDAFIEVLRGEDLAAVFHHQAQKAVFQFRQRQFPAVFPDLVEATAHAQAVRGEDVRLGGLLLAAVDMVAAQKGFTRESSSALEKGLAR